MRALAEMSSPPGGVGVMRGGLGRPRSRAAAPAGRAGLDLPHASERLELHRHSCRTAGRGARSVRDVESGKIKIEISRTYRLQDAPRAHADIESRQTTGSIVLVV